MTNSPTMTSYVIPVKTGIYSVIARSAKRDEAISTRDCFASARNDESVIPAKAGIWIPTFVGMTLERKHYEI
ncbi:MAG: hypothetical protein A3F16_01940 [Deltaproteobacteria bacterium RIFCSPHIGHO2_12_FULL_43_9]|nr:MAG: hypothetical protein A3F16_01940 [Deltaproteobacteria bacterium RIFCSPHIGHO2_12_FULL_43_9]